MLEFECSGSSADEAPEFALKSTAYAHAFVLPRPTAARSDSTSESLVLGRQHLMALVGADGDTPSDVVKLAEHVSRSHVIVTVAEPSASFPALQPWWSLRTVGMNGVVVLHGPQSTAVGTREYVPPDGRVAITVGDTVFLLGMPDPGHESFLPFVVRHSNRRDGLTSDDSNGEQGGAGEVELRT